MAKIGDKFPTRTHIGSTRHQVSHRPAEAKPSAAASSWSKDGFEVSPKRMGNLSGVLVPSGQAKPNLVQHGGAVLKGATVSTIYLGSYWKTPKGEAEAKYNDGFAKDFGQSSIKGVLTQYGAGVAGFGSSISVGSATPKRLTDSQVQAVVKQALASGQVARSAEGLYTVVLPPGTTLVSPDGSTSRQGLGGYHSSFKGADGKPVYYAAIAYSDAKGNGINFDGSSRDAVTITESHEWSEAATDPDVNSYDSNRQLGWYDERINAEVGDLAIDQLPLEQAFTRVDGYAQQLEWSNKDGQYEVATKSGR